MDDLSGTVGLVALVAAGVALITLVFAGFLFVQVRRLRAAQRVVLGDGGSEDLVGHAAALQQAFLDVHDRVEEVAARLDDRMSVAERRLDGAVAYRALVRYDAYGELSGHQSATLALLDAERNGIVLSSIANRETARMYVKQVVDGAGEFELSPEEDAAIRLALSGGAQSSVTLDA